MAVTIEFGHTYAPDLLINSGPTCLESGVYWNFSDIGATESLRQTAKAIGGNALRVALLDDVVPYTRSNGTQDSGRMQLFITRSEHSLRAGTEADVVKRESSFENDGRKLVKEVQNMALPNGYRLTKDGTSIVSGSGKHKFKVPLTGFAGVTDPTYPSCQVLDLAWLQHKLKLAPEAITMLPVGYEAQQRGVKILADLFPDMQNKVITSVFVDQQHQVVSSFDWYQTKLF